MLSGPNTGTWSIWALFRAFSALEITLLPSSAATWLCQLIMNTFSSGISAVKAARSFKEGTLLESLPVTTLGAVGVLGSDPMLSSLLSSEEEEDRTSEKRFLEEEEAETLLKECLVI